MADRAIDINPRNPLYWFAGINAAIFLALHIAAIFLGPETVGSFAENALEMPPGLQQLMSRPWTPVCYMFVQYDFTHLLFNMLWLIWFGSMLTEAGHRRAATVAYPAGGLAGALLFLAFSSMTGKTAYLTGSSAAVIAVVMTAAVVMPRHRVAIILLGEIEIRWIAVFAIAFDLISMTGGTLSAHIAHLGGAIAGIICGIAVNLIDRRRSSPQTSHENATLDDILDKIRLSGYDSLTPGERATLFNTSKRNG